ncbi:thiamine biosynthesis protein MoeB [Ammoniphilus oxalaticus]|uniref:Thiamine biosynthesis protein MoeB n=1 Tax=Ammoniphilus oxalaticus TaxID=66863 RepID=A0A419SEL7_9BACL|nr:thiazole biosynthesis adenylyltransferase ThiF [Ammoniphilus oxalaticus]RKD21762.1 thiamine biosynthesis protein MoeB [Ammoniphilus oxalaticus]
MSDRYSRQELFQPIGKEGQRKLSQKHVLMIGAGALGTGASETLVRAGVGKLTIVDRDYVEWSNLQRQQLYTEQDATERMPKAIAAYNRLSAVNSEVEIIAKVTDVTTEEIDELVEGVDLIMDATDNFDIRLLINDAAQKYRIPWIYGAVIGSYGLTYTILPGQTPCLSCLLESVPMGGATCDTAGIISPNVQMVVAYQTVEAMKILVEDFDAVRPTLLSFDLWTNQHTTIRVDKLKKDDCPSCGKQPSFPFLSQANHTKTAVLCGRDTVQIRPPVPMQRDLEQLAQSLAVHGQIEKNPYLVSLSTGAHRLAIFQDGRVLVHGTKDVTEARTLYHRFLG